MDVGRYEGLLHSNHEMHTLSRSRGYDLTYNEFYGGYADVAWRDDLVQGL